jgi:hypothetical protein
MVLFSNSDTENEEDKTLEIEQVNSEYSRGSSAIENYDPISQGDYGY